MKVIKKFYLHSDGEHMIEDFRGLGGDPESDAEDHFKQALFEVEFTLEVDVETGDYRILKVREHDQLLVPHKKEDSSLA